MPSINNPGRIRLTDALTKSLPGPAEGRAEVLHWDSDVEGFCLRVYATGRRVWMVRYRVAGKQRWITLGTPAELKAAEARKRAGEVRVKARVGRDERAEIEERKVEIS